MFWGDLRFLRDLYSGPTYFKSSEDAKEFVDTFLVRINNLLPFI